MIWPIVVLVMFFFVFRTIRNKALPPMRPHSPIESAGKRSSLPKSDAEAKPAIRDGKATVDTLMEDFAEGRISVEEYERLLDQLYKGGAA